MLSNSLDVEQRLALIELIDMLAAVDTSDKFIACMDGAMQRVLPHEWFICTIGRISRNGLEPLRVLTHRFPEDLFALISGGPGHRIIENPVLSHWWATRAPIAINFDDCNPFWPRSMTERAAKFDARNLLGHGQIDVGGELATYFSFHRSPDRVGGKQLLLLSRIVPNLHGAFVRAHATLEPDPMIKKFDVEKGCELTPRQIEILRWLHQGKTNWEISVILGMSVDNVKYHIKQITRKLQVTNRVQAVAAAVSRTVI